MKWSRRLRKTLTVRCLQLGQELAQNGDWRRVERLRDGLRMLTRIALPLRSRLKTNIRNTDLHYEGLLDAYFERAIDQMIMLAHVLRAGLPKSGCLEKFRFYDSFSILERAYAKGKGVISIAPHICGYPIYGGIVSSRIPCVIYMRHNKDPRKMRITEEIGRAGNGELIYPPKGGSKSQRFKVAVDVLRRGRMMFIAADTPRKPDKGVPVNILGHRAYFPTGVFIMSLRTGAPVVPVWWYWRDGVYRIYYSEPIELQRGGDLKSKAKAATQKWAADVDVFFREHPEMWWNWLDKRWTRILRNSNLN